MATRTRQSDKSEKSETGSANAPGRSSYERLSAQDATFVMFDRGRASLNVAIVATFHGGALLDSHGRLDLETVRTYVDRRLEDLPRYRQRLAYSPLGDPLWVDDERFDIAHHVHRLALPDPGTGAQLKQLAARLLSWTFDPTRPLWELCFVEGLAEGGFGLVARVHHSLVDGVSGVGVLQALLSPVPEEAPKTRSRWKPRSRPGWREFVGDGLRGGLEISRDLVGAVGGALVEPRRAVGALLDTAGAGLETLRHGLRPLPATPFNGPIGEQRRVDWHELDLARVRELRKRLDGTVNDVVLSIVAGGLRRWLKTRREPIRGRTLRVIVPVDVRSEDDVATQGNQVSNWFVDLPVGERDPLRRFRRIREQTRRFKATRAERGVELFLRFADWSGSYRLPALGVSLVNYLAPYNLIVTNVHGPPVPLYLLGSRLHSLRPFVPLFENQGLSVAVMSYVDRLAFGLLGDWDRVPDLEHAAACFSDAVDELAAAAELPEPDHGSARRAIG